jgi:hypothetical protein
MEDKIHNVITSETKLEYKAGLEAVTFLKEEQVILLVVGSEQQKGK